MEKNEYENDLDQHKYKYNKMVVVNIIQLIVIVVLTGAILFFAMNQKTILKSPFPTNKDEVISDGYEDMERLVQFAQYIASLTQNITYANANEQLLHILPLIESTNFDEVKKDLQLEARYIIRNKITQIFYVSNIDINQQNKTIKIEGVRERRVNGQTLKSNNNGYENIVLTINYKVKYGSYFRVINIGVEKEK